MLPDFTLQTEKPTKSTTSQSLVQMFEAFGSAIGEIFYDPNLKEKAKELGRLKISASLSILTQFIHDEVLFHYP